MFITISGRWSDIVLNLHTPTEDKSDNTKDRFYKELERILYQFLKYHMRKFVRRLQCKYSERNFYETNNRE